MVSLMKIFSLLSVLLVAAYQPAFAQDPSRCALTLDKHQKILADKYGESPRLLLALESKEVLTLYTNPETQTWTLARSNGVCSLALANGSGVFEEKQDKNAAATPL